MLQNFADRIKPFHMRLFLDDFREPWHCLSYMGRRIGTKHRVFTEDWTVVRDFHRFKEAVTLHHEDITLVSFDHDLCDAHYDTTLMATRVAAPRDKASVESAVNSVYNRIYPYLRNLRPRSLAELNDSILQILEVFNSTRMQKKDHSRKEAFELYERPILKPLPDRTFVPKTTASPKVAPDYHIQVGPERHRYSVPFTFIGFMLRVVYDTDHVEVYWNHQCIAFHRRSYRSNGYTTLKDHMPPAHLHYTETRGWDADYFLDRASRIGPATQAAIRRVLERREFREQNYNACLGILKFVDKYGPERLEAACRRLGTSTHVNFTMVRTILDRGLDREQDPFVQLKLPEHENIRGPQAYDPS